MVRFWGYSGDVGSVRFLPSGDVKSTYISRVKPYASRVKKSLGRRQKPVLVIVGLNCGDFLSLGPLETKICVFSDGLSENA